MTLNQQITRIERLVKIDKGMAQREADIAMRSQRTAAATCKIKAACRELGLIDTVSFL